MFNRTVAAIVSRASEILRRPLRRNTFTLHERDGICHGICGNSLRARPAGSRPTLTEPRRQSFCRSPGKRIRSRYCWAITITIPLRCGFTTETRERGDDTNQKRIITYKHLAYVPVRGASSLSQCLHGEYESSHFVQNMP